ncbi:MAG: hypothetical protein JNK05_00255 [Myxococcales bacterium]|nr:hypothetical protein [Myxococcales bacterium]
MQSYTHRRTILPGALGALTLALAPRGARAQSSLDDAPRATVGANGAPSAASASDSTGAAGGASRPRTATLRIGVGRGFSIGTADERVSLTIRAFVQPRVTVDVALPITGAVQAPPTVGFTVRRARLILQGALLGPALTYQLHLGFAPLDISAQSPLFDAFVTWAPSPNFQLRAGQFFVPFNRNRWISIMRQMFIERPLSTNEFNLDRDIGVMAFSNDLFGAQGRLGYALGVFAGAGRNRLDADYGLLYVARFNVNPLGRFDDSDSEWDLARTGPRLALGIAGALNHRQLLTDPAAIGAGTIPQRTDRFSAVFDMLFKWRGLTLQFEALARWHPTGFEADVIRARSGVGYLAQLGFVTPVHLALGSRISQTFPVFDEMGVFAFTATREVSAVIAYLALDGALNVSIDYTNRDPRDATNAQHTVRLQSMLIF